MESPPSELDPEPQKSSLAYMAWLNINFLVFIFTLLLPLFLPRNIGYQVTIYIRLLNGTRFTKHAVNCVFALHLEKVRKGNGGKD